MDPFPFTEYSRKTLAECKKWRDENYERNTKKVKSPSQNQAQNE
jgi:hypothetical protein